jgi:hypothetical protein
MPKQISAALCRLSTSAGFNITFAPQASPITISLARPILLTLPTATSGAAWKPTGDLLDRMLTVTLPPLTAETTRPEAEIAERFSKMRPKILGALVQAISVAMGRVDQIRLATYPRHADAAVWAIAAAPALNTTPESLQEVLAQKIQFHVPKDPLLQKLATLMAARDEWQGTATELKLELDLSDAPNHLSRKLKEVHAILHADGIEVAFLLRQEKGQLIRISKVDTIRVGWASGSAATSESGCVDFLSKNDRQIVSAEQKPGETITDPSPLDRQDLMPAATGTAPPEELPSGSGAAEPEERNHPCPMISKLGSEMSSFVNKA